MTNPRKADMPWSKVGNSCSDKIVNISDNSTLKIRVSAKQQGSSSNAKMPRDRQARFLVQNHANFRKSAQPDRVMYYDPTGSWVDYPSEVVDLLKCSFREGKAMAEVSMQGRNCLVDFYRMLEVEFESGSEKSIAWIDVGGKCFFPQFFVNSTEEVSDSDENGGRLEGDVVGEDPHTIAIQVKVVDGLANQENLNKRKRETGDIEVDQVVKGGKSEGSSSNVKNTGARATMHLLGVDGRETVLPPGSQRHQLGVNWNEMALLPGVQRHQLGVNGTEMELLPAGARRLQLGVSGSETLLPRWPDMRVLREEDKEYVVLSNLFLSGLLRVEPAVTITGIHQCAKLGSVRRERNAAFTELMETVQKARGDSNTVFAWYGTSARGVERILAHGFRMPDEPHRSRPYGVGVHLSPVDSPQSSAILSEVDDYGEKHVLLCRVILGNCEKVTGADEMLPSSPAFDTGVDDLSSPTWYVVWHTKMKTHIIPEVVVSFQGASRAQGITIPELISRLGRSLPPSKIQLLRTLLGLWKDDKVGRDEFMQRLKSVVGDEMVRAVIDEHRG